MPIPQDGKMWEAGYDYLERARQVLGKREDFVFNFLTANLFHMSRPSTVQALLLLGFREFGIGSMEQGWLFIGTFLFFRTLVNNSLCFVGTGIRMIWCQSIFKISAPHDIAGFQFGLEL